MTTEQDEAALRIAAETNCVQPEGCGSCNEWVIEFARRLLAWEREKVEPVAWAVWIEVAGMPDFDSIWTRLEFANDHLNEMLQKDWGEPIKSHGVVAMTCAQDDRYPIPKWLRDQVQKELAVHTHPILDTDDGNCEACASQSAAPVAAQEGMVMVRADVVAFLKGAGSLNGCWYGEKPTGDSAPFWWREYLSSSPAAQDALGWLRKHQPFRIWENGDCQMCFESDGISAKGNGFDAMLRAALRAKEDGHE